MTEVQKHSVKQISVIVLLSSVLGVSFALILYFITNKEEGHLRSYILLGSFTGFFISLFLASFSHLIRKSYTSVPLAFTILLEPLIQTIIIVGVYGLFFFIFMSAYLKEGESIIRNSYLAQTLFFSFGMTFFINSAETVNRLLGQKAVGRLLFGKYHRPVREKRFIMFLDLVDSTRIAEEIGDSAFHGFIRDFFHDITEPVVKYKAEIYKYVGDEVILTWTEKDGIAACNAIAIIDAIYRELDLHCLRYKERYGRIPEFRAGLHYGPVLVGELGDIKLEVAFLGDAMNTAARIQSACRDYEADFLISRDALDMFELSDTSGIDPIGTITLKGKEKALALFSIQSQCG